MLRLVMNLLAESRIESGRAESRPWSRSTSPRSCTRSPATSTCDGGRVHLEVAGRTAGAQRPGQDRRRAGEPRGQRSEVRRAGDALVVTAAVADDTLTLWVHDQGNGIDPDGPAPHLRPLLPGGPVGHAHVTAAWAWGCTSSRAGRRDGRQRRGAERARRRHHLHGDDPDGRGRRARVAVLARLIRASPVRHRPFICVRVHAGSAMSHPSYIVSREGSWHHSFGSGAVPSRRS